jgi:hypothetical protein
MSVLLPAVTSFNRFACVCMLGAMVAFAQPAAAGSVPSPATTASPTAAATAPGCNNNVAEAGNRMREARVAAARAEIVEAIPQPPSVLQQTCFNQATGVAAQQGGNIFSGDFTSDIQPIVGSALSSLYSNFEGAISSMFGAEVGGAIGGILGGAFGGGASAMEANYDCSGINDTWEAMVGRGVAGGVALTLNDMLSGNPPAGAGENFIRAWNASNSNGVFSNARTAMEALPRPQVQSYSGTAGLCETFDALGLRGCTNGR